MKTTGKQKAMCFFFFCHGKSNRESKSQKDVAEDGRGEKTPKPSQISQFLRYECTQLKTLQRHHISTKKCGLLGLLLSLRQNRLLGQLLNTCTVIEISYNTSNLLLV